MKVSFSSVNYNKNYSFKAANTSKDEAPVMPTKRQITDAKMKRSVSECFFVALGVSVLYLMLKVKGKKHFIARKQRKNSELTKISKELLEPILPTAAHVQKYKISVAHLRPVTRPQP